MVNVSAAAELVETTRTSTTDTIGQTRIDNLPINGRNYINFALTDSQVLRDNAPSIGAAPTSGLNISGQRARSNLVNVDGANAIDNSTNGVRSTVSQEAVQEFQIISNSYAAEYGQASGGVINIITRSGTINFTATSMATCGIAISKPPTLSAMSRNRRTRECRQGQRLGDQSRKIKPIITLPTRSLGGRRPALPALDRTTLAWFLSMPPTFSLPDLPLRGLSTSKSRRNRLPSWARRDYRRRFYSNMHSWREDPQPSL